jgi:hypothetical protein
MIGIVFAVLLYLWPLILIPLVPLALIRPVGRLVFFILGLAFFAGIGFVMNLGGPDSPSLIIPFWGLCLSVAALLAELLSRAIKLVRRRRLAGGLPE